MHAPHSVSCRCGLAWPDRVNGVLVVGYKYVLTEDHNAFSPAVSVDLYKKKEKKEEVMSEDILSFDIFVSLCC